MVIHVLDQAFNLVGVIDDYISSIWRPAYHDVGDFELYLNANSKVVNLLKKNYYLVRSGDVEARRVKNLLDSRGLTEQISNGITWTPVYNRLGRLLYVEANGTATANSAFWLQHSYDKLVNGQSYTICGCPTGGGTGTWLFRVADAENATNIMASDYGAGRTFTYSEDSGAVRVYLRITSGATVENLRFYPMIRLASDIDGTYEPYEDNINGNVVTYKKVMIIKNFALSTDAEGGDFLKVTGKELKYLLHQRIVWSQTNLTGTAENAIRQLVTENAISPTDSKRVIPMLTLGASAGLTDNIKKQVTGDYLDQSIIDICKAYDYGWELFFNNASLVLIVYQGVDRSFNQTERPYVVFSDDFENILNSDYELNSESYANTTLIGGEGEGVDRIYTTVGDDKSGLERFETFTDARDLSQNKDSEDEITLETYLALLDERGRENLASKIITEGFSGEVLDVNFKYGEDYYLGDILTVINKYGISRDVRVLSAIESKDNTGVKTIPQFNI